MTDAEQAVPVLQLRDATLAFDERVLWEGLNLDVQPGDFITVIGANGSGKSSLLKAILGMRKLTAGEIRLGGQPVRRGDSRIGYIPQQRLIPRGTPMRGRDLVSMGIDGHRWGMRITGRPAARARVAAAIESVGASSFAAQPVGMLSGGEQQRLRTAQALVSDPVLLLCDEPLSSLDLNYQQSVANLIAQQCRDRGTPVLFVTHDINPVLPFTDRVLYLAAGRHLLGSPDEILRSEVLSDLYQTPVEVTRVGDQVIVIGAPEHHEPHHLEVRS
ncbi:MAG: ATP-binding cassette domain-containing protein [Propionibacteriaceae bacterium]|jgi:zinc/manganese transport system ATP-binding protein|nr:ATP-binding cassette domain-containing protein [Propionibacteriaceae bacterium]